jgi:hypothetical protein
MSEVLNLVELLSVNSLFLDVFAGNFENRKILNVSPDQIASIERDWAD